MASPKTPTPSAVTYSEGSHQSTHPQEEPPHQEHQPLGSAPRDKPPKCLPSKPMGLMSKGLKVL